MRKVVLINMLFLVFAILLSACEALGTPPETSDGTSPALLAASTKDEPEATTLIEETATPLSEVQETPSPTPEEQISMLWINSNLPGEYVSALPELNEVALTESEAEADYKLDYFQGGGHSEWVYALVAPFKTTTDEVSFETLSAFWKGGSGFPAQSLTMTKGTLQAMELLFGEAKLKVNLISNEADIAHNFETLGAWAIVGFESLSPFFKVIAIDGQSPIHKAFDLSVYPLKVSIGLEIVGDANDDDFPKLYSTINEVLAESMPVSNRGEDKLATVIMTGVTAMVRATAKEMEIKGVLYPGEDVREILREADITHISNEIPFYSYCPEPQWTQDTLKFCSDPRYIDLLLDIGTDVVDLTGDHFADFGSEAMYETLDIYKENNLPYFGGGRDIEEAKTPVKFEVNGNKIAFIGCNGKEAGYATVSHSNPGAYSCDMDYMIEAIHQLVSDGYLPIVTFQHFEYYHWGAEQELIEDFRLVAEAGAVIVSGSQGHQPHAYEFHDGAFIHYGLGNLFFDQLNIYSDTDKAFIDRFVFYDGKLISVELITTKFYDWSKPVIVVGEDREVMLQMLFEVSDWKD